MFVVIFIIFSHIFQSTGITDNITDPVENEYKPKYEQQEISQKKAKFVGNKSYKPYSVVKLSALVAHLLGFQTTTQVVESTDSEWKLPIVDVLVQCNDTFRKKSTKGRNGYTHSVRDAFKKGRCKLPPSETDLDQFLDIVSESGSQKLLNLVNKYQN